MLRKGLPRFHQVEDGLVQGLRDVRLSPVFGRGGGVVGVGHHVARRRLRERPHAAGDARTREHLAQRSGGWWNSPEETGLPGADFRRGVARPKLNFIGGTPTD